LRLETGRGIISNGVNEPTYIHNFQNIEQDICEGEREDASEKKLLEIIDELDSHFNT
jgi:hypothetical protein